MSNRLFQTMIHQMRDVVGRTIGVIDENGIVIACSEKVSLESSKTLKESSLFIKVLWLHLLWRRIP